MTSTGSLSTYEFFTASYPPYDVPAYIYIIAIMFETLLYGMYIVLFFVCVYILLRNKRTMHTPFLVLAILMFSIATADLGVTYAYLLRYILRGEITPSKYVYPKFIFHVTNSVLSDALVIYRCYIVWGRDKRIVALPCILLLAATVCGYLFQGATSPRLDKPVPIYLWMTLSLNTFVTLLTAGRIWWISWKARKFLGDNFVKKYNSAIAVIVESGAIYSIYVILDIILSGAAVVPLLLDAGMVQIVGIVPTLIIVQVGLSRDIGERANTTTLQPEPRGSVASDMGLREDGRVSRPTSVRLAQVLPERDART